MPYTIGGAAQVGDLVTQAFLDLTVIQTGNENLTVAMQTDAFLRLNQLIDRASAKGVIIPNQVSQTFQLLSGVTAYTLGSGGTFATTGGLRALKITAWRAVVAGMAKGGRVLSLAEFGEQLAALQKTLAELNMQALTEGQISAFPSPITAPIPSLVGADTSYPLINVRVGPVPSILPGQLELLYLTPVANFVSLTDPINLPQGWQDFLHWHMAESLWSLYPRAGVLDHIKEMCQQTEAALGIQNAMSAPQPQPAAPQGQQ